MPLHACELRHAPVRTPRRETAEAHLGMRHARVDGVFLHCADGARAAEVPHAAGDGRRTQGNGRSVNSTGSE